MMQHRPGAPIAELYRREEDGVEVHVVLAHELEEANVIVVEPPTLPLGRVVCRDAGVTDRCVKLDETRV